MFDSQDETYYRGLFLVDRFKDRNGPSWTELKESAERTTRVVRETVESLVESRNRIGDAELKALYHLCQNCNDGRSAEEKQDLVRELGLPDDATARIVGEIDSSVGSVGQSMQEPPIHVGGKDEEFPELERDLHGCFTRIVDDYEAESELVNAVRDILEINFYGVQAGRISPVFHYLAPEIFPVINGRSCDGMELVIGESVSQNLSAYLDEREIFLEVREALSFENHFRELDYFLHWVQSEENVWTKALREGVDRDVWQVQPGRTKYSFPEVLWPIWKDRGIISIGWNIGSLDQVDVDDLDSQPTDFLSAVSSGDIIVAKGGHNDLLGLGVASPEGYEDIGGTDREITFSNRGESENHPSIRHVDWIFTRDIANAIDTEDWGSKQFHTKTIARYSSYEELRLNLGRQLSEEVIQRLEQIETVSIDYATRSYFILQTGSDEWEDDIAKQYHFKMGNPGTRKLWDAGTAQVVYLEDGDMYATARVVDIEQEERDGEKHCFAQIEGYEEFEPVNVNSVRGEFERSISLQHSIIEITGQDYQTVIDSGTTKRYFWVNAESVDWQEKDKESFYQVTSSTGGARRNQEAYQKANPGDEVLVYQISPTKQVVGRAHVTSGLHEEPTEVEGEDSVEGITLQWDESLEGVSWQDVESDPELDGSRLVESDNSFVITQLTEGEYERILELCEMTRFDDFASELTVPDSEIAVEQEHLHFPEEEWDRIQSRVEQALANGNHVLLFGPPGTGKTKLARQVCEATVGEDTYELVTASADWSTFDTVGGYQTTTQNTLEFEPGVVLDRFQADGDGTPANEWLVIDELNRADIDKAFGSLFSALTGESVTLPFDDADGDPIEILDASRSHEEIGQNRFFIPEDWRMLATMNTLDKTSLYEMSYAFMRRWAFVPVGIPDLPAREDGDDSALESLVADYVAVWAANGGVPEADQHYETVGRIWRAVNEQRAIGPAIVEDIYEHVAAASSTETADYVSPIIMYVFPQLEGLRRNELEQLIGALDEIVDDETGELWTVARDFFQIDLQPGGGE